MCCFTQRIHTLRLSVGGRRHGRKIFTQYSGISSCSLGSTDNNRSPAVDNGSQNGINCRRRATIIYELTNNIIMNNSVAHS